MGIWHYITGLGISGETCKNGARLVEVPWWDQGFHSCRHFIGRDNLCYCAVMDHVYIHFLSQWLGFRLDAPHTNHRPASFETTHIYMHLGNVIWAGKSRVFRYGIVAAVGHWFISHDHILQPASTKSPVHITLTDRHARTPHPCSHTYMHAHIHNNTNTNSTTKYVGN